MAVINLALDPERMTILKAHAKDLNDVTIHSLSFFQISKRVFDILMGLVLLPAVGVMTLVLLVLNPLWNKGSLFYVQKRMGRNCQAFRAFKFRTMSDAPRMNRKADDPLEECRITVLGRFLRKSRIDELPQIFNVIRGDMSLIGPRPDYFPHALQYLKSVPGYRDRHVVRPGISGLAQIEVGYVQSSEETRRKVQADLRYIENMGFGLDTRLVLRTIGVVIKGLGK